ncbi:carbohydrate ABC transporter permease [Microbacterium sp. TWP3-1-2b2]|uniref:carbohydrate ABC transporter permease n=1 Tax=Microbacterium sp. TWP3-1-2b2 TaxID=2804651 RepID=UPI003CFABB33
MSDTIRKSLLVLLGLIWLAPVYLIIVNAAKTQPQYAATSPWQATGFDGLFENVAAAWTRGDLSGAFTSTIIYSVVAPTLAVLIGAAAGFAIVALRLKHGFVWFVIIFCSTVFPIQMLLMPLFLWYADWDLYDTRWGLILVYAVTSVSFAAFVMRNFFTGIAHQVFEAAVVDGASSWRIFWRIYLPLARPALVALFILQATGVWNDLLLGLTLTKSEDIRPLMASLAALTGNYGGSTAPVLLAGGVIVSIPTVLLFLATQRAFSRGLSLGQF